MQQQQFINDFNQLNMFRANFIQLRMFRAIISPILSGSNSTSSWSPAGSIVGALYHKL